MDTLRLEPFPDPEFKDRIRYNIFINGSNLIALTREAELPFATKEGHPEIAGGYIGFCDWDLGEYYNSYIEDGKINLLSCGGCGDEGCWGLFVQITTTDTTIIWNNFFNNHRTYEIFKEDFWDHSALGPFIFTREQYHAEFAREFQNLGWRRIGNGPRRHPYYGKL